MDSSSDEVLKAFRRATNELMLCPNRVWAVAGEDLPKLLPRLGANHKNHVDAHKHERCTFDFCEYSRRDFTAIQQRHECEERRCTRIRNRFPRKLLAKAASSGRSTVWNLTGDALLEPPRPYMAISHVWSDGTGTGAWRDEEVNRCLHLFFRDIAEQFQCEGIWWDTLCIPREKAARTEAIRRIQSNYQNARITLVHDLFLRNWEWDPKTACFAILMSPWFSRGWTALELAKSPKVKVIFKGRCGPVIKDLDEEILASEGEENDQKDEDETRRRASQIIRNLRKEISSLNELLTVLGPRYTSWPKDISIIAALLMDVEPEEMQQNTYMHILEKIVKISPGHLFHNTATMSTGFTWCPTNLFCMPLDNSPKTYLSLSDNGIRGKWRIIPVDRSLEQNCLWNLPHPLIRHQLQETLTNHPEECWLLAEYGTASVERALLVRETQETREIHEPLYCQYVGALYFRQKVIATAVDDVVIVHSRTHLSKRRKRSISDSGSEQSEMLRRAIWMGDYLTFSKLVGKADLQAADQLGRRPLHLAAERGHKQMIQDLIEHLGRDNVHLNVRSGSGQTALHCAAWAGSAAVVELLRNRIDETAKDKDGNTALHVASQMGFAPVAKLLIKGSTIDMGASNNLTPLHFAIMHGHRIVAELLEDANIQAKDSNLGWTPLHCAAVNGDQELVRLLIDRGAEVNAKDDRVGWTPLHLAAMNGYKTVIRPLLKKGAHIMAKDKYDWTPRHFAEMNQYDEVVELLGSKGIDDDAITTDWGRWTPLHCKAIDNARGIIDLLTDSGANIYLNDKNYIWNPLQFAIENELGTAIPRLLEWGANVMVKSGQAPFHRRMHEGLKKLLVDKDPNQELWQDSLLAAVQQGYEAVARLLLEESAQRDHIGIDDCTPLHLAVRYKREAIVRLLLEAGVNKETKDESGGTPLDHAVMLKDKVAVQLLLEAGANTENERLYGQTPLNLAIRYQDEAVVRLLLEAGANTDTKGIDGETPLYFAIRHEDEAAVRLLLEAGANTETEGRDEKTPLHYAIRLEDKAIARLLLKAGARPEAIPADGWIFLHQAIDSQERAIIRLLLEEGSLNLETKDACGRTAMHLAVEKSDRETIRLLLEAGANKEVKRPMGLTPLHYAVRLGDKVCVQLLLKAGADKEAKDSAGRTPLHNAIGHEAVAQLLLEADGNMQPQYADDRVVTQLLLDSGANRDAKDSNGRTPLHYAVRLGDRVCVQLLLKAGADKEAKDSAGRTPLNCAAVDKSIAQLLLKANPEPDVDEIVAWLLLRRESAIKYDTLDFDEGFIRIDGIVTQLLLEAGTGKEA